MLFSKKDKNKPQPSPPDIEPSLDSRQNKKSRNEIEKARQDLMLAQLEAMRDLPETNEPNTHNLHATAIQTAESSLLEPDQETRVSSTTENEPVQKNENTQLNQIPLQADPPKPDEPISNPPPIESSVPAAKENTPQKSQTNPFNPAIMDMPEIADPCTQTLLREIVAEDMARKASR